MATISELRACREMLTAQRSTEVARVSDDGKTVDYRSVAEIDRAIETVDREITAAYRALKLHGESKEKTSPIRQDVRRSVARYRPGSASFNGVGMFSAGSDG